MTGLAIIAAGLGIIEVFAVHRADADGKSRRRNVTHGGSCLFAALIVCGVVVDRNRVCPLRTAAR